MKGKVKESKEEQRKGTGKAKVRESKGKARESRENERKSTEKVKESREH